MKIVKLVLSFVAVVSMLILLLTQNADVAIVLLVAATLRVAIMILERRNKR